MAQKIKHIIVSTEYDEHSDTITAHVLADQDGGKEHLGTIKIVSGGASIDTMISDENMWRLPVVSEAHLVTIVVAELVSRTTAETEIPMLLDVEIGITL